LTPYYSDGSVTIYHGDLREAFAEVQDCTVDMIWTDPPYGNNNHDGDFNAALNKFRGLESQPIANDSPAEYKEIVDYTLDEAVRVLRPTSSIACCSGGGGPRTTFAWLADRLNQNGLRFFHAVIWDKLNPGLGWRYRRQYEFVMIAHLANGKLGWADERVVVPNIYRLSKPRDRRHPNEKPLPMVERFVQWHTRPTDLVLDPLMGSGTTLVAAKNHSRRAIGFELNERYCEVAASRCAQGVLELVGA